MILIVDVVYYGKVSLTLYTRSDMYNCMSPDAVSNARATNEMCCLCCFSLLGLLTNTSMTSNSAPHGNV